MSGTLAMPLLNDIRVPAVANTAAAANTGSEGSSGESPFRMMISQAIAANGSKQNAGTPTEAETGTPPGNMNAQEANETSGLLAEFISGSLNLAKLSQQIMGKDSLKSLETDSSVEGDALASEPDEASTADMFALFNGQLTAYLAAGGGNPASGLADVKVDPENTSALPTSVQTVRNVLTNTINLKRDTISLAADGSAGQVAQTAGNNAQSAKAADSSGSRVEFSGLTKDMIGKSESGMTGLNSVIETSDIKQNMTASKPTSLINESGLSGNSADVTSPDPINSQKDSILQAISEPAQTDKTFSQTGDSIQVKQSEPGLRLGQEAELKEKQVELDGIADSLRTTAYQSQIQSTGSADPMIQTTETTEAYSQISGKILSSLEQKGPTEFKMQLEPENLGQIDINLKIKEGKLIIDIIADKAYTQNLLTSQVDKLISSMGLQNVQVESVQVGQQMNSDSRNGQSQTYQMNSGMDFSQGRQNSNSGQTSENKQSFSTGIFGRTAEMTAEETLRVNQMTRESFGRMNYVI